MKISVIVPVYNLEKYIEATLDSISRQTYHDLEIIVVDDGSSDRTPGILIRYASGNPIIKVIHKQNAGVTAARMTGLENATGDYIGFVDGDDLIDPDMYERLLANAIKYHAEISHCGYRLVKEDSVEYFYDTGDVLVMNRSDGLFQLLEGSKIEPGLCNKLFQRELIDRFLKQNQMDLSIRNNEDLLMNYYLFSETERSVYEDFCPYQYTVRQQSASKGTVTIHKLFDPVKVAGIILQETKSNCALRAVASHLYVVKLIRAATYFEKKRNRELKIAGKAARKELRSFLPEYLKLKDESKKRKLLAVIAAYLPHCYNSLHKAYLVGKKNTWI